MTFQLSRTFLVSLFLIVLSWMLKLKMAKWGLQSQICCSLISCNFSERHMIWPCGKLTEMPTAVKIDNHFECFPLVNNRSYGEMMLFGNGLITLLWLTGSNSCFSDIITDVFSHWDCVKAQMNVPNQKIKLPKLLLLTLFCCTWWSVNQKFSKKPKQDWTFRKKI